jgi:hypothetical protein
MIEAWKWVYAVDTKESPTWELRYYVYFFIKPFGSFMNIGPTVPLTEFSTQVMTDDYGN